MTVAEGRIRLNPRVKKNIKAFIQWSKDEIRLDRNPETTPFPVGQVNDLMKRAKTHASFIDETSTMSESAKPVTFKEEVKWEDWSPAFKNYLRTIPGRNGVPLSYIIRDNEMPDPTPNDNFLDDYVAMAPLQGHAFVLDANKVKTLMLNMIMGNIVAESKVQALKQNATGREVWTTLKNIMKELNSTQ